MAITITGLHHITLTVTNIERSREFYTQLLGFQKLMDLGPTRTLLGNGTTVLALTLPSDASMPAPANDRFHENRVGLDHVSFTVGSRDELDAAVRLFDEHGVQHGTINDLSAHGIPIYVLAFRDPDNIQLELTAPHG